VQSYCREHLLPQKTPKVMRRFAAFALTAAAQVQKFVLREQWEQVVR